MSDRFDTYVIDGCLPDDESVALPKLERVAAVQTPRLVDLRGDCSPVEDQGKVGSCVANAVVGALEFHQIRKGDPLRDMSRLFVYYNARRLGDRIGQSGTRTQLALAGILGWGACPANMWPYQPTMVDVRPTEDCYKAATKFMGVQFAHAEFDAGVREALAAGFPVCFGMAVPPRAFAMARHTGEIRPPADGVWEDTGNGGHAMLLVGYDDERNAWLVRNSWGADWADNGHVWIDYEVMRRYTSGRLRPMVVGAIEDHRAFRLSGASIKQVLDTILKSAPATAGSDLAGLRRELASELDDQMSKTRSSIRDRLRGPGAGGGY